MQVKSVYTADSCEHIPFLWLRVLSTYLPVQLFIRGKHLTVWRQYPQVQIARSWVNLQALSGARGCINLWRQWVQRKDALLRYRSRIECQRDLRWEPSRTRPEHLRSCSPRLPTRLLVWNLRQEHWLKSSEGLRRLRGLPARWCSNVPSESSPPFQWCLPKLWEAASLHG